METRTADFVVTTNKCCFLCLARNLSPPSPFRQSASETFSINSLQLLSTHLKLDMSKVFSEEENVPKHLLAKVKRSTLKVELCADCTSLNETLSKLCPKLEKIEMELMSCISRIHRKLMKAVQICDNEESSSKFEDSKDDYEEVKQEIAQVLRSELMRKCSNKITKVPPQVKIQRLTMDQVNKKRLEIISQRKQTTERRSQNQDYNSEKCSSDGMPGIQIKVENSNQVSFTDEDIDDTGNVFDGGSSDTQSEEEESHLLTGFSTTGNGGIGQAKRERLSNKNSTLLRSMGEVGKGLKTCKFNPETRRYDCCYCNKSYTLEVSANKHYKTEHLKIRYECTLCRKKFSQRGCYSRHHRDVHSHAKLFKCHVCDYTSTRKYNLTGHVQRVHLRKIGKRFPCKFCSKSFSLSGNRNFHMRNNCLERRNNTEADG